MTIFNATTLSCSLCGNKSTVGEIGDHLAEAHIGAGDSDWLCANGCLYRTSSKAKMASHCLITSHPASKITRNLIFAELLSEVQQRFMRAMTWGSSPQSNECTLVLEIGNDASAPQSHSEIIELDEEDCINLPEPKKFPAFNVAADNLVGYSQDLPQLKYQKAGIADMNHFESEEEPSESEAEVESPMSPAHESSIQAEFGEVLPTYVCKHCNYSCKEHCRLVTHVLQRHTSKEKTQTCSYCPYATNRTDNLKIHIQRHIGERPFKCIECTYAANSTAHLNRHQLTHTGERPVELRVEENIDLSKPKDRILFRDADPFLGHSLDLSNISYKEAEISIQNSENNDTDHDHYKFEKEPSESEAAIESHMSPVPEHSSHEEMVVQMVVNENDSSSPIESPPHPSSRSSGERQKRRACTCPNCKANGGVPMEGPDKRKMHLCHYPKCAKTYGKTTHLHDHLRRHENKRPFGCDFVSCEKRFTRSDELQRHRRTHTGIPIFPTTSSPRALPVLK